MPKEKRVKKKQWVRPKLIILIRGKPEEALLAFCKVTGYYGPNGGGEGGCHVIGGGCDYQYYCDLCSGLGGS